MESSRNYAYYKKHAQDVKLEDITSSEQNKDIVRKLRDGDSKFTTLLILTEELEGDNDEFIVDERGDDLDWLGYFIGESKELDFLCVAYYPFPPVGLLEGICRNRSINELEIKNAIADTTFIHLAPFFEKNNNMATLTLGCDRVGSDECAQYFLVALVKCNSLKTLCFEGGADGSQFSDEAFNNIIRALHSQSQLERIYFNNHLVGGVSCAALGSTLRMGGIKKLKRLDLTNNNIDDDGLLSLVAGMEHCLNLVELGLQDNEITVAGLTALSSFLQSESCKLESLNLMGVDIDDEGAIVLATGLMGYKPLNCLYLSNNRIGDQGLAALVPAISAAASENLETLNLSDNLHTITGIRSLSTLIQSGRSALKDLELSSSGIGVSDQEEVARILVNALMNNTSLMHLGLGYVIPEAGMEVCSRLLCDTSSINNIYSSNHTLESGLRFMNRGENFSIEKYLHLNLNTRHLGPRQRQLVPMCKVLIHYPDLADMKPFYQWKLAFLPLVADWFHRASTVRNWLEESVKVFQSRKLSAMYKFIRGVPMLVADGYWSQQLKQIQVKKRNFDEAEKQMLEILAKKRRLEEEETQVLHRLGGKRESD